MSRTAICAVPPPGWTCTREPNHDGPFAAIPTPKETMTSTMTTREAEWLLSKAMDEPVKISDGPEPDADGWIAWGGGKCPVRPSLTVSVRLAHYNEVSYDGIAGEWDWDFPGHGGRITAYKLAEPEPLIVPDGGVIGDEPDADRFDECKAWLRERADLPPEGEYDNRVWHPEDPDLHFTAIVNMGVATMAAMIVGRDVSAEARVIGEKLITLDERSHFLECDLSADDDEDFIPPPRVFIADEYGTLVEATPTHVVRVSDEPGDWEALDGSGERKGSWTYQPGSVVVLHP